VASKNAVTSVRTSGSRRELTLEGIREFVEKLGRFVPQLREEKEIEIIVPRYMFIALRADLHEHAAFGVSEVHDGESIVTTRDGWIIKVTFREPKV
jgi:hypothetical protein